MKVMFGASVKEIPTSMFALPAIAVTTTAMYKYEKKFRTLTSS